jgi:hypothetical protein
VQVGLRARGNYILYWCSTCFFGFLAKSKGVIFSHKNEKRGSQKWLMAGTKMTNKEHKNG